MGVKFGTSLVRAKFHPHRCNMSPLRGEKPQNRPLNNLNRRVALPVTRHRASASMHSLTFRVCHSNATRTPIANPSNSPQLGGIPYHCPNLHLGPCNSVGMRPRTDAQTDRQRHRHTDAGDHNKFRVVCTTHAKCNYADSVYCIEIIELIICSINSYSSPATKTRHTTSTSMYSLTFRVRVMLP